MSDVGEVAGAVKSISDLVGGLLERADRDGPDKKLHENKDNIQNAFARNSLDDQWALYYRLFSDAGYSPTPGGTVGETDREFRHHALHAAAELIYAKQIIARLVAIRVKE